MFIVYLLLGVLALFVLCGIAAMIFFKFTLGKRDSWRSPDEKKVGSGEKMALLLYQPSNGKHNIALARSLAELVAARGYSVTVNYPSGQLTYDPAQYDLLLYGSPVYIGETSKALRNYIQSHPVTGKQILLFVTGMEKKAPELEALKLLLPDDNQIYSIKVAPSESEKLLDFAKIHIK